MMGKDFIARLRLVLLALFALMGACTVGQAQISFPSAINLALQSSPRVKMAQEDINKARAVEAEARDVFIPSLSASVGAGATYGITLTVPTIFTISSQSLVFNYSQRDNMRAAKLGVEAARLSYQDVCDQVEEDAANAYLALDSALQRQEALTAEHGFAMRLVAIVQQRLDVGVESPIELKKARRTEKQVLLQLQQLEDEIAGLREHLGTLTGLPGNRLMTVPDSIPSSLSAAPEATAAEAPDSLALQAAEANVKAKQQRAFGMARYLWRPQIAFEAQYGRISPINNVSEYYNLHGNYNTAEGGVQVQLPFLDAAHKARARQAEADALHAAHEADYLREQENESRVKLQHSIAELQTKAELAEIDRGIAQDQLDAMLVQINAGSGNNAAPPMTPKEEQNARIQERQRYLDFLNANLQLQQAQISLMRQMGELAGWLKSIASVQGVVPVKP